MDEGFISAAGGSSTITLSNIVFEYFKSMENPYLLQYAPGSTMLLSDVLFTNSYMLGGIIGPSDSGDTSMQSAITMTGIKFEFYNPYNLYSNIEDGNYFLSAKDMENV